MKLIRKKHRDLLTTETPVSDSEDQVERRGSLDHVLSSVRTSASVWLEAGDYMAVLREITLQEFNPARGQSVRAKFDVGQDSLVEGWWRLMDRQREPVSGGILGVKILLDKLGYPEESYETNTEQKLHEIFAELTANEPEVQIRISYKDGWLNIRALAATGKESE